MARAAFPLSRGQPEEIRIPDLHMAAVFALHGDRILDIMGDAERGLVENSERLLGVMRRIAEQMAGGSSVGSEDLVLGFLPALYGYFERFTAWKGRENLKLERRIRSMLVANEDSLAVVRSAGHGNSALATALEREISSLRSKMVRSLGQAKLDAYDESRRGAQRPVSRLDVQTTPPPVDAGMQRNSNEEFAHELLIDPSFQLSDTGDIPGSSATGFIVRMTFYQVMSLFSSPSSRSLSERVVFVCRISGTAWLTIWRCATPRASFVWFGCWLIFAKVLSSSANRGSMRICWWRSEVSWTKI